MDFFLAHHHADREFSKGLADDLIRRGLMVGPSIVLWPQMRLLPRVDEGLIDARTCVVVVSREFLKLSWPRKELDGLALRRRVVSLLHDVTEAHVADHSRRLAVAAIPPALGPLVRLLRPEEDAGAGE